MERCNFRRRERFHHRVNARRRQKTRLKRRTRGRFALRESPVFADGFDVGGAEDIVAHLVEHVGLADGHRL